MTDVTLPTPTPGASGEIAFDTAVKTFIDEAGANGERVVQADAFGHITDDWLSEKIINGVTALGENVMDHGAVGDDDTASTDDTAAFQATVDALPAGIGGTVVIPGKSFHLAGEVTYNKDNVFWVGMGARVSRLRFSTSTGGITVGDGVAIRNGGGFSNLGLRGNQSIPPAGLTLLGCWQVNLTNLKFEDFATYHLNTEQGGHIRLTSLQFSQNAAWAGTFCRLYNGILYTVNGMTFEGVSGASTLLRIGGAATQATINGITGAGGFGTALVVEAATQGVTVNGMSVKDLSVSGIVGAGADDLKLNNVVLLAAATPSGLGANLTNTVSASLSDFTIKGWGDASVQHGGAADLNIHDGYVDGTRPFFAGSASTGTIHDNNIPDGVPTVVGTGVRYYRNTPWQPQGAAAITVTASPFTYTAGATPEVVYISGGTVSAIAKNSVTLFASTDKTVYLEPGEAVVVTYSSAPTMVKDRK